MRFFILTLIPTFGPSKTPVEDAVRSYNPNKPGITLIIQVRKGLT